MILLSLLSAATVLPDARISTRIDGLSWELSSGGYIDLRGVAQEEGPINLDVPAGLEAWVEVREGDTAHAIALRLQEAVNPGPFEILVTELRGSNAAIGVVADDPESLATEKARAEALYTIWKDTMGADGLVIVAQWHERDKVPQFDPNLAIIWFIEDGSPTPAQGVVLQDGTIYVVVPGFAGMTWLGDPANPR
jgi:hypothetical protein